MTKPLCIYHGKCADGFGAAWAVWKALGAENVDFHAGVYGNPPPDVTGRKVIMVDFSYKRPVIEAMAKSAQSILILDHHKTAAQDLAGFAPVPAPPFSDLRGWSPSAGIYATFDMNRSGAGIAWDHFHPGPRPKLIDHLEDRDLWRFALPGTREIQASVFSYPYDFEVWDKLILGEQTEQLRQEGVAIERKHHKDVAELSDVTMRWMKIAGELVPIANMPYTLTSDAGHLLCKLHKAPFAGCFWMTPDGWVFSLRSLEDGADVSEIAKRYDGGGHAHAAGFQVPIDQLGQFLL